MRSACRVRSSAPFAPALVLALAAEAGEQSQSRSNIGEMGHAPIDARLGGEQRRNQYRQRRVLRTADGDLAVQAFAALYDDLIHLIASLALARLRQNHPIAPGIILKYFDLSIPPGFGAKRRNRARPYRRRSPVPRAPARLNSRERQRQSAGKNRGRRRRRPTPRAAPTGSLPAPAHRFRSSHIGRIADDQIEIEPPRRGTSASNRSPVKNCIRAAT